MTTVSLAAVTKTENGIGIHTGGGTEIGRDPENTGTEIVTGLRVESVTVTGIGVTETEDIVTATKEETEKGERSGHLEKTEINPKNKEKKKDTARLRAPKRPVEARKRVNWCRLRKRAEEHVSQRNPRTKILSRERRVSGLLPHDHVTLYGCYLESEAIYVIYVVFLLFRTRTLLSNVVSSFLHTERSTRERDTITEKVL